MNSVATVLGLSFVLWLGFLIASTYRDHGDRPTLPDVAPPRPILPEATARSGAGAGPAHLAARGRDWFQEARATSARDDAEVMAWREARTGGRQPGTFGGFNGGGGFDGGCDGGGGCD